VQEGAVEQLAVHQPVLEEIWVEAGDRCRGEGVG